ncbi:hypothetical protein Taro_002632 [Colocasia esculenta]|uniref:Uncharacterized protein n=1 Tax=Colocasia esculenta TaxID=4460 RepID=A0A843TPB3_COLES|nr:hypothetical protein [Colocasia esculenta]
MPEQDEAHEDEIVEAYQENLVDVPINGEIFDVGVNEGINRHHRGVRGMVAEVPLEHYKGKTFEVVVASVPPGVDPSDWRTCVINGIQGRNK